MILRTLHRTPLLLVPLLIACAEMGEPADHAPHAQPTLLPQRPRTDAPWNTAGLPPPLTPRSYRIPRGDAAIAFHAREGVTEIKWGDCVSKGAAGPVITSKESLPVGNGRQIECTTFDAVPATIVFSFESDRKEEYCLLGSAVQWRRGGDELLTTTLTHAPVKGAWTFTATSQQSLQVPRVYDASTGATNWPIWIQVHYQTIDLRPANGKACSTVF